MNVHGSFIVYLSLIKIIKFMVKNSNKVFSCKNNSSADALIQYMKKYPEKFKPLTKDEERQLIKTMMPDREDELREILFNRSIRYVFNAAKKYAYTTADYDELISSALCRLADAAKRFNLDKGTKFLTFARMWVFKGLTAPYYTKEARMGLTSISMDSTYSSEDDNARTFENYMHEYMEPTIPKTIDANTQLSAVETTDIYSDLLNQLNTNEKFDNIDKQIFEKSFVNKTSVREISADLNIPPQLVNKRKKNILLNMKLYLRDKYNITQLADLMDD